jgi:ABC-type nitrate/sulfonate/bicarbonate transport system substrate-binding protein
VEGEDMKHRLLYLVLAAGLIVAACGGDDGGGGGEAEGAGGQPGIDRVQLAIDTDDYMNNLAWVIADERYWPNLGFQEDAEIVATDEYMAGLLGGDVWVIQGESDVVWAALAEGSVPMKIVGVEKDTEAWFIGIREGVDENNLEGLKISGGETGDRNITVGEMALEDMGVDPESLEWVPVEGSSDDRLTALIAGQIDVAVLQPRHLIPLREEGGKMIYQRFVDAPQEVWVVTEDFLEEDEAAVCAYLEGRIKAKRWIGEGDDYTANQDEAIEIARNHEPPFEPAEGDLAEWENEVTNNWSLDGGAPADAFDKWTEDMIADGIVPEGFDWRDHADFNCVWEIQDELGVERNPNPEDM